MVVAHLQQHVIAKNSKTSLETSSADGKTLVPVSEMGRITCDMEFRFMLHRHWSLYEVCLLRFRYHPSTKSGLVEKLQIIIFSLSLASDCPFLLLHIRVCISPTSWPRSSTCGIQTADTAWRSSWPRWASASSSASKSILSWAASFADVFGIKSRNMPRNTVSKIYFTVRFSANYTPKPFCFAAKIICTKSLLNTVRGIFNPKWFKHIDSRRVLG